MIKTKAKGARLERELKEKLNKMGYLVIRQAASQFPDLIALHNLKTNPTNPKPLLIECKTNKYLTKPEKEALENLNCYGMPCIAYPIKEHNRKIIVLCNTKYKEFWRIY